MSWYEEATKAIVALINAAIEERGDMPEPKEITAIIAKHDPNRWIPVSEGIPEIGMFVEAVTDVGFVFYGSVFRPDLWVEVNGLSHDGVTHWRRRVRPEVKHGE